MLSIGIEQTECVCVCVCECAHTDIHTHIQQNYTLKGDLLEWLPGCSLSGATAQSLVGTTMRVDVSAVTICAEVTRKS